MIWKEMKKMNEKFALKWQKRRENLNYWKRMKKWRNSEIINLYKQNMRIKAKNEKFENNKWEKKHRKDRKRNKENFNNVKNKFSLKDESDKILIIEKWRKRIEIKNIVNIIFSKMNLCKFEWNKWKLNQIIFWE